MKNFFTLMGLIALVSLIGSCAVNPVTGRTELSVWTPAQEVAIGEQYYLPSQQSQGGRYVVDPDLTAYVNEVGRRLWEVSDRPGLPYELVVLNNNVPNAWALPGGKMAINRGLLVHFEDEAQLASVLGHEIVHAAARHGASQATQNMLLSAGVMAAGLAAHRRDSEYGALAVGAMGIGAYAWQARYSRSHELQADRVGAEYMVKAGYDPQGAVELQEIFVRLSEGRQSNWLDGLFASHPPSRERLEANQRFAERNPGGVRNKARFDRAMAQLRRDQPAYEQYDQALAAAGQGNYTQAMTLVDQAIAHQPRENLFWELKGRLLVQQDKHRDALDAFNRSLQANPEFFRPYVYRGLTHRQLGNRSQAEQDLQASQRLLPTQLASFHLGELALERGARSEAIEYFRMAAQGGGELGAAAEAHLARLEQEPTS